MTKAEQRIACLRARGALSREEAEAYSRRICAYLAEAPEFRKAKTVMSYIAADGEAEPAGFDRLCSRVCYPKCLPERRMEAYIPGKFSKSKFGIYEPEPESSELVAPEDIDLVLVPCVGFDGAGRRLGHGAGYYDRYLIRCVNAAFVLVGFEAQRMPELITDEYDVTMHYIVTENGLEKI